MSMSYDPLGLASCVMIRARVAMRDIWRSKFDWDDPLPPETCDLWNGLLTEIENLKTVEFPRGLKPIDAQAASYLHVFSDASMTAYGAMAYLMWQTPEGPKVNLVSAKARVAPLRQTTIPRLELMGALAASRLAKTVFDEFKEKPETVTLWTDSQIVLQWLRAESVTMKAFVGVRVAEIQSTWHPTNWRFVPTNLNPADDLSRGLTVAQLNDRWIYGPSFLKGAPDTWPAEPSQPAKVDMEFKNPKSVAIAIKSVPIIDAGRFSDWQHLLRVTGYCLRFVSNALKRQKILDQSLLPEDRSM